jgi:hypothetical protein
MKWEVGYYIRLERDQSEIIFFSENVGKMILLSSFELNVGSEAVIRKTSTIYLMSILYTRTRFIIFKLISPKI